MNKQYILITIVILTLVLVSVQCSTTTSAPAPAKPAAKQATPTQVSAPTQAPAATQPAAPTQVEALTQPAAPSGVDAKALTQDKCTQCHSFNRVTRFRGDASAWKDVVDNMIQQGMNASPEEQATIIKYLADTYK
jgi:cytochrome c5